MKYFSGQAWSEQKDKRGILQLQWRKFGYNGRGLFREINTKEEYFFFPTELEQVIPLLNKGFLQGEFKMVKRGREAGLEFVRELSPLDIMELRAEKD